MGKKLFLRNSSTALMFLGAILIGAYVYVIVQGHVFQARASRHLAVLASTGPTAVPVNSAAHEVAVADSVLKTGSVLGELDIPRLGIHTVVLEGDDSGTLRKGAGHIPETAMPDDFGGNVAIAAHRDTFFRPLRFIRPEDLIVVKTPTGSYRYRVRSTQVVEPDDVAVLDNTGKRILTLVTCFPFFYVGSAPHRFIVRAAAGE